MLKLFAQSSPVFPTAQSLPRFGRKATESEIKEMKQLIKTYMPFAPKEADHFVILDPLGDFAKKTSQTGILSQFFREGQEYRSLLQETYRKKGRLNAYVLSKFNIGSLLSGQEKTVFERIASWAFTKIVKMNAAKNDLNPAIQLFEVVIPGVGILRRFFAISKK